MLLLGNRLLVKWVTAVSMLYFAMFSYILLLYDEGEIKFIIWSQILTVKAQWLLCVQPALIQMAVFACTLYLCVSYGCQMSDCSLLLRGPRIQRQAL